MYEGAYRWRYRDIRPSYEDFVRALYSSVLAQFMILSRETQRPLGLAVAYQPNFKNQNAYIALQGTPDTYDRGLLLDAGWLFIDWLFKAYNFRKLYAEAPGVTIESFASGFGDIFVGEGCLREHEYANGKWWDYHLLAIHRSTWDTFAGRLDPRFARTLRRTKPPTERMSFSDFVDVIAQELELELGVISETTDLCADLGFDSITHLELIVILEGLGCRIPQQGLQALKTLGDAHFLYLQHQSSEVIS